MKIGMVLFLLVASITTYAQQLDSLQKQVLKQTILASTEVKDWQDAMISYQKSDMEFCALKYEQKLNQSLFNSCGKAALDVSTERFILKLFRTMRITDELKVIVTAKESAMRKNHPELATHFKCDEIFPDLYRPVSMARTKNIQKLR